MNRRLRCITCPTTSVRLCGSVVAAIATLLVARSAAAQLTQEQFFKSVQKGVEGPSMGAGTFLALMLGVLLALLLVIYIVQRLQEPRDARPINSPRKLVKEVLKNVPVRSAELKQLSALADAESLQSPLTLLLCPSLLDKAGQKHATNSDPRVVAQLTARAQAPDTTSADPGHGPL